MENALHHAMQWVENVPTWVRAPSIPIQDYAIHAQINHTTLQ